MTETTFHTERRMNSYFDQNYQKVCELFRPEVSVKGVMHKLTDAGVGDYIKFGEQVLKREHNTAASQVRFYDRLTQEISKLPEWIRKQITLRAKEPSHGHSMYVSIGRTLDSDPDVAKHSVKLYVSPLGNMFHTKAMSVRYEGKHREELPLPMMADLDHLTLEQHEFVRKYNYAHLGLASFYKPLPSPMDTRVRTKADSKATTMRAPPCTE